MTLCCKVDRREGGEENRKYVEIIVMKSKAIKSQGGMQAESSPLLSLSQRGVVAIKTVGMRAHFVEAESSSRYCTGDSEEKSPGNLRVRTAEKYGCEEKGEKGFSAK